MTQPGTKVGEGYVEVETRIDEQRTNRLLGRHFTRTASSSARVFSRSFSDNVNLGIPNRAVKNVDRDVDRHSRRWISRIGYHFFRGFEGIISLMPARLETVFTKTGPIIGTVLVAGLLAAVVAAAPMIGAALTGGIVASIGLGAMAAGIALVAKDPRIAKAGKSIQEKLFGVSASGGEALTKAREKLLKIEEQIAMQRRFGARDKKGQPTAGAQRTLNKLLFQRAEALKAVNNAQANARPQRKSKIQIAAEAAFVGPTVTALGEVGKSIDKNMPHVIRMLTASAKFIPIITKGVTGFMDAIFPALDQLVSSPFMTDLMKIFAEGLIHIGQAISDFFTRLLSDPNAQKGALKGFEDLLNLIASTIRFTGDFLRAMSRMWQFLDVHVFPGMRTGWKGFRDGLNDAFGAIKNTWTPALVTAFGDTVNFFQRTWTSISSNTRQTWTSIAHFFRTTWTSIAATFRNSWTAIADFFRNAFTNSLDGVKRVWNSFWGGVKSVATAAWNGLRDFIARSWLIQMFIAIAKICGEIWMKFWKGIALIATTIWTSIYRFLSPGFQVLAKVFLAALGLMLRGWQVIWGAIRAVGYTIWQAIAKFFGSAWNGFRTYFVNIFNSVATFWSRIWNGISGAGVQIWKTISGNIVKAFNAVRNFLFNILGQVQNRFIVIFNSISGIISTALKAATTVLSSMINGFIGVINFGIDAINTVLGKLGIKSRLPRIGGINVPFVGTISQSDRRRSTRGNARGGYISGPGSSTSDSIYSRLSDGEYVIRASSVDAVGVPFLNAINGTTSTPTGGPGSGFAAGGLYKQMTAWIQSRIPSTRISSDYRPGDPGYHGSGNAIDMVWPDGSERRGGGLAAMAFNLIKSTFFSGIKELIWDFAGSRAVWNGKEHFFTGPGAGPGTHNDHIHWAMGALSGKGGGNLLSGIFGLLGMGWDAILKKLINPAVAKLTSGLPDNGLGWIFKGAGQTMGKFIVPWIRGMFNKTLESLGTMGFAPGDITGLGAKNLEGWINAAIKIAGVPLSWAGPLRTLVMRESGGNPRSINLWDSNAARGTPSKGLAQVIGPTFATYRDRRLPNDIWNPIANLVAALRYIISRYGSIFNVQQANARMSPKGYDTGGIVPPGDTWVRNRTGSNEYLFNSDQMNTMSNTRCVHNVYVDGVKMLVREEIDSNNNHLVNAVSRGRRLP